MRDRITEVVCGAIRELNGDLGYEQLSEPTPRTELYGSDSALDSLSLVMLVSAVEAAVAENFGREIVLASEKAMSMRNSPYRNVGSFVEFIEAELAA